MSVFVSIDEIKKNDYSFGVAQYFKPDTSHVDLSETDFRMNLYKYRKNASVVFRFNFLCAEAVMKMFDYWFVQYDFPHFGKPYKTSGGKMRWEESLHKFIPESWTVTTLSSICDILLGGTPDTSIKEYWDGEIPWLNSGEIAQFPIYKSEKRVTKRGIKESATSFANKGAVLISITRYIRASVLAIDACFNQSVVAVIPNSNYPTAFLYPFIESQIPRYMALRTGAQQPHINKNTIEETLLAVPPLDSGIMAAYVKETSMIYKSILEDTKKMAKAIELDSFDMPVLLNGQALVE